MKFIEDIKKYFSEESRHERYMNRDVKLQTLDWNHAKERYELHIDKVKFRDLPDRSVEIRGKKNVYIVENLKLNYELDPQFCTAADLCAWMDNNDITDALAYAYKPPMMFDMKKVMIIGGCIIAGLLVFYFTQGH